MATDPHTSPHCQAHAQVSRQSSRQAQGGKPHEMLTEETKEPGHQAHNRSWFLSSVRESSENHGEREEWAPPAQKSRRVSSKACSYGVQVARDLAGGEVLAMRV